MMCGTCGATIADKAIVCYRCGTATAIPAAPLRKAPPSVVRPWALIVLLLAVAAVLGWLASSEPPGTLRQIIYAVVGVASLAWGGLLAWRGRRPV